LTANYAVGAGEMIKSEFVNGENNFHYTNALGSVTSLANSAGSLTSRNEYNAFGELSTSGNTVTSIGYTMVVPSTAQTAVRSLKTIPALSDFAAIVAAQWFSPINGGQRKLLR
jgi:hypothetical protein